jgi:hypothetical protein
MQNRNRELFLSRLTGVATILGLALVGIDPPTVKPVKNRMFGSDLGTPPKDAVILTDGQYDPHAKNVQIVNPTFVLVAQPQGEGRVEVTGIHLCDKKPNADTLEKRMEKLLAQYGRHEKAPAASAAPAFAMA